MHSLRRLTIASVTLLSAACWLVVLGSQALAAPTPEASPSASGSDPEVAASTTNYDWLWGMGGLLVVLGLFVAWRFLLSARR